MSEYIEREALRAEAIRMTGGDEFVFDNCFPYWQFSKSIKEAPAADVAPVVHGRWREDTDPADGDLRCTHCGVAWPKFAQDQIAEQGIWTLQTLFKYCPVCGCRMDGGEKHE